MDDRAIPHPHDDPAGHAPDTPQAAVFEDDLPLSWLEGRDAAIAIITGVEGPSYRRRGAGMVIAADGRAWGTLSSGCLEQDVIAHAKTALATGEAQDLRYGRGSPFFDIVLPCGGTLDIRVIPRPDPATLSRVRSELETRRPADLALGGITVRVIPRPRVLIFGAGPETGIFAALARAAGYPVDLHSPDPETLAAAGFGQVWNAGAWPEAAPIDPFTAIALFFHDHDREIPLLQRALASPAFYIGAQGSLRAHRAREAALLALGAAPDQNARLASPFGLIPSTRDARTLAISVLADIAGRAQTLTGGP